MYIYMGMSFNSQMDVPDFGSITMNFVGTKELGYVEEGYKRFRKYTFQSTDFSKLALITNALDGSEAFAVDTGTTYVLYNKAWYEKTVGVTSRDITEILGDITSIDYQIVSNLPIPGVKGTIYLISHNHGLYDAYDEYIWTNDTYERIGNTDIDLNGYIPTVTGANNKVPKFNSQGKLIPTGFELKKTVPSNAIFTDTTYNAATQTVDGLMSASDKTKLDGITISDYLRKDDIVTLTAAEYEALATKTAPYYFITDV